MKGRSSPAIEIGLLGSTLLVTLGAPAFADAPQYEATMIDGDVGWGINNAGQVVGEYRDAFGDLRAFLYSDGDLKDLGTLGGLSAVANEINDAGQITGASETGGFPSHAKGFLYSDGVMRDIGDLGGPFPSSIGHAINDAGEITGVSRSERALDAFLYSDGRMHRLELSRDACDQFPSFGYDINNSSQITGFAYRLTALGCRGTAFLYEDGAMLLIGALLPEFSTIGYGINDSGQVVLQAIGTGEAGGYLYTEGRMEKIGDVIPWAINDSGWVVGQTGLGGSTSRAFLYLDGEMFDLNDLVADMSEWDHLRSAQDINDSGQITGFGLTASGEFRAFLLIPLLIEVRIDVKPGSKRNPVNLRSKGKIPVVVLSTGTFDATQVNRETVTFGPDAATEAHHRNHLDDIDGDGDMDSLLHFETRSTGIRCDDREVRLTGKTFDGRSFAGTDAVEVVKCRLP